MSISVVAAAAAAATAAVVWGGTRRDANWLWSIDHRPLVIRTHPVDAQSLAIGTGGTRQQVQVIDRRTGKNGGAGWNQAILAESPAGQPAVVLEFDATARLNAIDFVSSPARRLPVEPPCPEINATWFASGGSIVGLGLDRIAHVTADGRCRVAELGKTTLNFWLAGIDSTGLVYVASDLGSDSGEQLYTIRPEDAELRAQRGVAANEVLAIPSLPGAVVADRKSIALFSGTRAIWRTREVQWAGPRTMARSGDFVGVRIDQAGTRGITILKARDGGLLQRVRLKTGGAFEFAGRCLLSQDIGESDWVAFRALDTGVSGRLAMTRLSTNADNPPAPIANDISFVQGIVLVQSGGHVDAYRMPDACR